MSGARYVETMLEGKLVSLNAVKDVRRHRSSIYSCLCLVTCSIVDVARPL
jgi:hypothetical protein